MAIGVTNPESVVTVLDTADRFPDSVECCFGVIDRESEVNVNAAARVGQPQLWFPEFEVERAC